jgi:hypothetical protein
MRNTNLADRSFVEKLRRAKVISRLPDEKLRASAAAWGTGVAMGDFGGGF